MDILKIVSTNKAPNAIGPYSQAVRYGNFIFCSGQIAIDPNTGKLTGKTIKKQTGQVLKNLSEVLKSAGSSLNKVVKTTVYLVNLQDFQKFNKEYAKFFKENKPVRATVEVSGLPKNALIEIEAIAIA